MIDDRRGPATAMSTAVPLTDFQEALRRGRRGPFDLGGGGATIYVEQESLGAVWPFAAVLNEGLRQLIARHEMLRSVILSDGRLHSLAVTPDYEVGIEDLTGRSHSWIEERRRSVRDEMLQARNPLERWPLFDVLVHQVDDNRIRVFWRFEAILLDRDSVTELFRELAQLMDTPDRELLPLGVSFQDHARALDAARGSAATERAHASWLSQVSSLPPPPMLPLVRPLSSDRVPHPVTRRAQLLSADHWQALHQLADVAGMSSTTVATAAFAEILRLRSARPDFSLELGGSHRPPPRLGTVPALGNYTVVSVLAVPHTPGSFQDRARWLQTQISADEAHPAFSVNRRWCEYQRRPGLEDQVLLPVRFTSAVDRRRPDTTTADEGGQPSASGIRARPIESTMILPQILLAWTVALTANGECELFSQAAEELLPRDLVTDLIDSYRELLTRLATGGEAWQEDWSAGHGERTQPSDRRPYSGTAQPAVAAPTSGDGSGPRTTPRERVEVCYFHPPTRPFSASCAIVNATLNETLEHLGYQVDGIYGDGRRPSSADIYVPLRAVGRALEARTRAPARLSVHCDLGLQVSPLQRKRNQKNVVFFHGFAGAPDQWAGNPLVDRYWGNSRYTREVLQALLALPDWRRGRILDPRAFDIVAHLTLALPCLEDPDALQEGSAQLPRSALEAIDAGDVLGHAVEAAKVDERALVSILLQLNRMAQEHGLGRRFRVFVAEQVARRVQSVLTRPTDAHPEFAAFRDRLEELGLAVSDLLIPLPRLAQPTLFELIRACRFGLFYNSVPESFGFYALESVFHNCPVYTNGAGNLRHLLPAGCGIHVDENEAMAFADPQAYRAVAEAVYTDSVTDPAGAEANCRRGIDFIAEHYNRDAFRRDVSDELDGLDSEPQELPFNELTVRLSPLVRLWNPVTGRALTDHSPRQLSQRERHVAAAALGRTCGEIRRSAAEPELDALQQLFHIGVLALADPRSNPQKSTGFMSRMSLKSCSTGL